MNNLKFEKLATDEIMSLAELKEDIYYKKIPKDKISYYIDESIRIGQEVAKNVLNTFGKKSVVEICEDKKVKLDKPDEEYDFEILKLRGEYNSEEKSITLYDLSIKKFKKALIDSKVGIKLNYDEIKEIQIAHELYHYLEDKEIGDTYEKLEDVRIFLMKKHPIMKTSDVAAHIFCKELLNLPFHPKLLDYYCLIGTKNVDSIYLKNYIDELYEILNR